MSLKGGDQERRAFHKLEALLGHIPLRINDLEDEWMIFALRQVRHRACPVERWDHPVILEFDSCISCARQLTASQDRSAVATSSEKYRLVEVLRIGSL